MCYYIKKCEKVIMGYRSQCLQTQPAKEEVTGNLCSSLPLKHCPGSRLRREQSVPKNKRSLPWWIRNIPVSEYTVNWFPFPGPLSWSDFPVTWRDHSQRPPSATQPAACLSSHWTKQTWKDLDLSNSLRPLKLSSKTLSCHCQILISATLS